MKKLKELVKQQKLKLIELCDAEKALQDAKCAAQTEQAQKAVDEAQTAQDLRLAEIKEAHELCELKLKEEQEKAL